MKHIDDKIWFIKHLGMETSMQEIEKFQEKVAVREAEGISEAEARKEVFFMMTGRLCLNG